MHPGTVSFGFFHTEECVRVPARSVCLCPVHTAKLSQSLLCRVCECLQWKCFLKIRTYDSKTQCSNQQPQALEQEFWFVLTTEKILSSLTGLGTQPSQEDFHQGCRFLITL